MREVESRDAAVQALKDALASNTEETTKINSARQKAQNDCHEALRRKGVAENRLKDNAVAIAERDEIL